MAYRTLLERARMLEGLVRQSQDRNRPYLTSGYEQRLAETVEHVDAIRRTLSAVQAPSTPDAVSQGGLEE